MHCLSVSWCIVWALIAVVAFHHFSLGENDIIVSEESDGIVTGIPDDSILDELNDEKFIPTNEWQVIKKGQAIPAGLHVRMNFQTGVREAKLMDSTEPDEEKQQNKKAEHKGPRIIIANEDEEESNYPHEKLYLKKSHLKQVFHDFKDKIGTKDVEHVTWSDDAKDALEETLKQEKKKFRSMKEIKEDLEGSMGWNIKSDVEIMKDITKQLMLRNVSIERTSNALDHLEDYVHQVDNGRDLEKIGGLKIIVQLLNRDSEIIQEKAANVIGAAAQSNKEVQDAIFNHGGLNYLINMFDLTKQTLTQKKGLYAVSAVIRGNHNVQSEFVKVGGLKAILRIIKQSASNPIKVKAVTLLYDLIVEQNEVMQKLVESGKKKTNEKSPLLKSLYEAGWCELLTPLLKIEDFDAKEKVIQAIIVSVPICSGELRKDVSLKELKRQSKELEENIRSEEDDDFKGYLITLKQQLDKNVLKQLIPSS